VGWFLLAHIGLPLLFGTAFVIFSAAVSPTMVGWDVLVETAQDLAILSLGATGAIFDNSRVEQAFGSNSALMAIGLVGVELILSAIIVFARAKAIKDGKHFSLAGGIIVLFLGFLTLGLTAGVLVWAYSHGS
jgi:hypothetical protein